MEVDVGLEGVADSLERLQRFIAAEEKAAKDALEYILRKMVTYVKHYGPWEDQTSNLRNSISININTMREWPADTPKGALQAMASENEKPVLQIEGDDYVGVLSAGMEYAIWVELKEGYWVLTGAIDRFQPLIEQYMAGIMAVENLDLEQIATVAYAQFQERRGA